ncbi:hypothetical protein BGX21_006511, partial [Mortierella sp. AD011]
KLGQWLNHSLYFPKHGSDETEPADVTPGEPVIEHREEEIEVEASPRTEDQEEKEPEVVLKLSDAESLEDEGGLTTEVGKKVSRTSIRDRAHGIGFDDIATMMEPRYGTAECLRLRFDPVRHEYWLDGRPGIVLSALSITHIASANREVLAVAAVRIHLDKAIHYRYANAKPEIAKFKADLEAKESAIQATGQPGGNSGKA